MIRGTCVLPAGLGKTVRVCVFADPELHEEALKQGADMIGDDAVLKAVAEGGELPFDKILATPEYMPQLKGYARILGPKGLMPNVKSGTLVKAGELLEAVVLSKQGLVEFRVNEGATIMNKVGKRTFNEEDLVRNADSLLTAIARRRPESIKGRFFKKCMIKTSMGPPI